MPYRVVYTAHELLGSSKCTAKGDPKDEQGDSDMNHLQDRKDRKEGAEKSTLVDIQTTREGPAGTLAKG